MAVRADRHAGGFQRACAGALSRVFIDAAGSALELLEPSAGGVACIDLDRSDGRCVHVASVGADGECVGRPHFRSASHAAPSTVLVQAANGSWEWSELSGGCVARQDKDPVVWRLPVVPNRGVQEAPVGAHDDVSEGARRKDAAAIARDQAQASGAAGELHRPPSDLPAKLTSAVIPGIRRTSRMRCGRRDSR